MREWEDLKAKSFKGKYKDQLEFSEGWRIQTKKPCVGRVWIFPGTTEFRFMQSLDLSLKKLCEFW